MIDERKTQTQLFYKLEGQINRFEKKCVNGKLLSQVRLPGNISLSCLDIIQAFSVIFKNKDDIPIYNFQV